jgi:signal transduction histidine kinase
LIDATVARLNDDPNEDPMALHEKELERESLEKQKQIYKTLYNVLFIGAGVSAMLTMMTAALFYRQVYVRLKDIIINIDRMIKRSPLIPAKKSKDELGELEQAILRTAEQIANLEQLRSHNAKLLAKSLLQSLDEIADKLDELKKHGFEEDSRSASTGQDNAEARINSAQSLLDRLRFLLTDLLSIDEIYVARLSLHYRTCSLSDIVSGAVEATSALGRSRRIEVRTNIKDVSVECDSTRIVQVITNLVSNAIKFSPESSEVTVDCSDSGDFAIVSVRDHGRGITSEFKQKMFHRFEQETTQDQQKGSGLGLSICRDLIEAHGGSMDFESEPGNTVFRVKIPLRQPKLELPANQDWLAQRAARKPVLLKKAIALVAIPAMVQLVVIASLAFLIDGAQKEMAASRDSRMLATKSAALARDLILTSMKAVLYNAQGIPRGVELLKEREENVRTQLAELKKLTENDPQQRVDAEQLEGIVNHELESAYAIASSPERDMKLSKLMGNFATPSNRVPHVGQELDKTINAIRKNSRNHPVATEESRAMVYKVLLGGIFASMLASIIAALIYSRFFSRRIDAIIQNTRKLQANEPLSLPSKNQDEIGQIDREFYSAAQHLKMLDRFKDELLSVTSHELRTPLTSLLGTFELLSTGMYGALNANGTRLLQSTYESAASLVSLLTNFLDLEKMKSGKALVSPQAVSVDQLSAALSKQATIIETQAIPPGVQLNADSARLLQAISAVSPQDAPISMQATASTIELTIPNSDVAPDFLPMQVGLALCEEIARQHGGDFISEPGGRHRLRLPRI